ncbi:MAG: S9 family peptidase [Ilumatobacteraceae bacterium]
MSPPIARRVAHTWQRPTGAVDDPWAWLADRDDPETMAYLRAENAYADEWFAGRAELVESLVADIRRRTRETDLSVPVRSGAWWYVSRTVEGLAYPIHCRGRSIETATEFVLLDENLEAAEVDYFALQNFDVDPSHRLVAWSGDVDGGELCTMRVRDLDRGTDLDDRLEGTTWGGTAWSADSAALFYVTPDAQMRPCTVWRHLIGTPQADDVQVFHEPDERFHVTIGLTRSQRWIVIECASTSTSEVHLIPAAEPERTPTLVTARRDGVEYTLDHWGDRWLVLTNLDATDFRVMSAPDDHPDDWQELVPAVDGQRITAVEAFRDHAVLHEWVDAQPRLRVLFRDGSERTLPTGDEPHDVELDANPEYDATTLRFVRQSFTSPATVFEEDVFSGVRTMLKQIEVPDTDLDVYVATRMWATADDGTRIPVDVVRHRETPVDGSAPLVVYGYGAYEISLPPWFSVGRLALLDRGAVWALVHPRGGGELGRNWYLDGRLERKINTFTDTLACVDHLVAEGWGSATRVAIRGGSAGGLLVGACVTMRPEMFRAAVAEVPFVDVITTMSDPTLPLTVNEWEEWGDPRRLPDAEHIAAWSPYDNTVPGAYPALLVTAGLNDPRVRYHEPAKWVARLREVSTSGRTILLRTELGAGHRGPSGRYDAWRDEARVLAFLLTELA